MFEFLKTHHELASWLAAFGVLVSALIALFIALVGGWLNALFVQPKLSVKYSQEGKRWNRNTNRNGYPAINTLLEITNEGKSTAKNTVVKIEKIEFSDPNVEDLFFHPSPLHWSGQDDIAPMDVYPGSYALVDFLLVVETGYTKSSSGAVIPNQLFESPRWELWVDYRKGKGLHAQYEYEGNFNIYFHLASDNAKARQYLARISWQKSDPKPLIKIERA